MPNSLDSYEPISPTERETDPSPRPVINRVLERFTYDASDLEQGSASLGRRFEVIEPSKFFRAPVSPQNSLVVLQQWEGFVTEINKDEGVFVARLLDITSDSQIEEEEAEFAIDDVDENDTDLLQIGAVFRWLIGYRTPPLGRTEKVSSLIFRRLPHLTTEEITRADDKARRLSDVLLRE